ncbi:MAG: PhoU-like domain fused to TrkA-C domain [Candidatus Methanohalarchaeum thermophilum]|uniref:PhoU-like domain fused to TrkA-C domain n=1 Tax=Methanohalarchaeum thermophilum TaxID=1903181 RepID=A0A1Q6DU29_METT1|nr:MAG: PhoU-like domain fused to TrkA-C domain [Candidatus Methanohalarchaeum thermophilum]
MKDVSELILDLSYSAVIYNNKKIAKEALRLEERMDELIYQIRISSIMGARNIEDAKKLSSVLQIAEASEKISNAAGDIAKLALENKNLPEDFIGNVSEANEIIIKSKVKKGSKGTNKTLGELKLESKTGLRVIAIRKNEKWIYNPVKTDVLDEDDTVIARGGKEGLPRFYEILTGKEKQPDIVQSSGVDSRPADIAVEMKDVSELATGLAYSAILFYTEDIAEEVQELEEKMDTKDSELEIWVLKAAKNYDESELGKLRSLLRIGRSSEIISDAAGEMADIVLRGLELHPIFALAVRESEEIITKVMAEKGSEVINKKLGEIPLKTKTGMHAMAIKRGDNWIYNPSAETILKENDFVIARGTREGEERLKELLSS